MKDVTSLTPDERRRMVQEMSFLTDKTIYTIKLDDGRVVLATEDEVQLSEDDF